jgi:hypothetical protein
MTGLISGAALILALGQTGWERGYATHYRQGLFEQVADNRGMPRARCMVADDRTPLGAFVAIRGARTGVLLRCQTTDVSAPKDKARHLRDGLVELDYHSGRAICGKWFAERWRNCPVWVRR